MSSSYTNDIDDVDVFGVLSGVNAPTVFTYPQFLTLVTAVATRMSLDADTAIHLFNLSGEPNNGATDDTNATSAGTEVATDGPSKHASQHIGGRITGASAFPAVALVNPPLCAHLAREGTAVLLQDPDTIPTVLCRAPEDGPHDPTDPLCHHGAPHVHCLRCFHNAVDTHGRLNAVPSRLTSEPVPVTELKHGWVEHYQRHRHHSQKLLGLLDGTHVAYVGDSDDEYDLETDKGVEACEAAAAEEARHGCFLLSAGTAARPLLLGYCAECNQFAPLTCFTWTGGRRDSEANALREEAVGGIDSVRPDSNKRACLREGWDKWVAVDDSLTVMAKLLLACHLVQEGLQQRQRLVQLITPDSNSRNDADTTAHEEDEDRALTETTSAASGPQWVFLYKPAFFAFDSEDELIHQFEDGAECTHGSAILPAARVVGLPPEPKLLLLHEERAYVAPLQRTAGMSPPYHYAEAVEGFLMDFGSPAVAAAKVAMALQHDNRYRSTVRLIYVEDVDAWESALVVYNLREEELDREGANEGVRPQSEPMYVDLSDPTQSIRMKRDYTIQKQLPSRLWADYIDAAREAEREQEPSSSHTVAHLSSGDDVASRETDGLPFSLQSRTLNFFASVTSIALVLGELLAHP